MKLNEFKKAKLNELDLSSFIGDYGSAAVRSGLGSFGGKNVLSTTDQMAKDEFTKNFTSRAFSGLQSAINSGLVDPTAAGKTSGANIGTNFGNNPAKNPVTNPVTNPTTQVKPTTGKNVSPTPAQKRGAANTAGANAFGQMANQLTAKKSPEQIRQEKQAAATGVAQDQMNQNGQFSKLPPDQFNKTAANTRQQKQGIATQNAQDQMTPMSKLPADQFAKTAASTRQNQQTTATQNAQDQMNPVSKLPADQFAKSASNVRQQQQGVATQNAQGQMNPVSKLPADQFNKSATNVRQRKQSNTTKSVKKPKDNTITMTKRNVKPRNAGKNAFGQMTQNLGKVAESTQFDKLNYIFESILAEATMGQALSPGGKVVGQANQQQSKQTISQYITNFFKQFMKGINISDPSVTTQVASLAKELEQNYAKDKGKSTLPKLADLGWSVSHAQAEENPQQATTTPAQTGANPSTTSASSTSTTTPQAAQASTQQAKMTVAQITKLMQGLSTRQKQSVLKSLQTQLSKTPPTNKKQVTPAKNNTVTMPKIKGAKAGAPTPEEEAKFQQRIQQASGK